MLQWDEQLVDKMKQGEQEAFKQCYQQLSATIYTAIIKICKNRDTANDLLQDTFVDAFKSIDTFNQTSSFIAWLKRIAFNNTFNFIKKDKRLLIISEYPDATECSTANFAVEFENRNLLLHLFNHLSKIECLIMWLYIVEQYTHVEIAKLVNKTPSYSKTIVARCLKKLRAKQEVKKYAY